MPALSNNEVRHLFDFGPAGVDPETGRVEDPALEEWGRVPFEQQSLPQPGTGVSGGLGRPAEPGLPPEPAFKRLASTRRDFIASVAKLGYLVERIEEVSGPEEDPYQDPAL
jgi:hypothetical protein